MAKIRGGLGKALLIQDLTKPISFHIPKSLEPPPIFERRYKGDAGDREGGPRVAVSSRMIFELVTEELNCSELQIFFHFKNIDDALLIESAAGADEKEFLVKSVEGKGGEYSETVWENSSFSKVVPDGTLLELPGLVSSIEVIAGKDFIEFSSLDDFYEWLEL